MDSAAIHSQTIHDAPRARRGVGGTLHSDTDEGVLLRDTDA